MEKKQQKIRITIQLRDIFLLKKENKTKKKLRIIGIYKLMLTSLEYWKKKGHIIKAKMERTTCNNI